ncbi:MAG TPA: serine hydrolase domain-containing protein [Dyella sp.]|nr:serine hydrolase domain-containing protein [Dyella sp.]
MPFRPLSLALASAIVFSAAVPPALAAPRPAVPTTVVSNTPSAQLPPARVHEALADYRHWLDELARRRSVAGLATAVVVNNKVAFEYTLGYANEATKEPIKPETVFRLASLSKAFATGLTALLVHDGKLSWDTHLTDALPFFKLKDMQAASKVTVGDILGQRVGLPRNTYDNMLEDDVPYEELVRKLDEVDMTCGPGQCYGYQNVAFSLIGDVIYTMTGDFFYRLVDKRLFYPLGMKTASYGRAALESSPSWAHPHRALGHGRWRPFEPKEAYYRVAPAAGVNASLRDMEQWLIAQMGGRPDVLPADLLAVLHAPGIPTPVETRSTAWRRARITEAHYGLGWRVFTYGGETMIYHAGAVEGYRTMIGFLPKYHVGIVTMWNSAGATPSGLMPMMFDRLLALPHVDWAGLESPPPSASKRSTPRKRTHARHKRHR